jgi:arylformamidase
LSGLIDIAMPVSEATPAWPGSPGARTRNFKSLETGDDANASILEMDVHTGTHVDAPAHMLAGGAPVESIALEAGLGEASVADTGDAVGIDAVVLEGLGLPPACKRLLLRTRNSWRSELQQQFADDYSALTLSGAEWIVKRQIQLVGIDYLSIQLFNDTPETHHALLRAGVVILEGLRLDKARPGRYELLCLPLSLPGCEASPARAVVKPLT